MIKLLSLLFFNVSLFSFNTSNCMQNKAQKIASDSKQVYLKATDGVIKLDRELIKDSEMINDALKVGKGSEHNPIHLPFGIDQLSFINGCLISLREQRTHFLSFEKLGNLSLGHLAQLIRNSWFLKTKELCGLAQEIFINKIKSEHIDDLINEKNFIRQFEFEEPLKLSLARLILHDEDMNYIRSLLFRDLRYPQHDLNYSSLSPLSSYMAISANAEKKGITDLWNLDTAEKVLSFESINEIKQNTFNCTGLMLAILTKNRFQLWELIDKNLKFQLVAEQLGADSKAFWGMSASPDNPSIVLGLGQSLVILNSKDCSIKVLSHKSEVDLAEGDSLQFCPSGYLFGIRSNGIIRFWNTDTLSCIALADEHKERIIKFRNDNLMFVTLSENGTLCLWSLETGKLLKKVEVKEPGLCFDSHCSKLVCASKGGGATVLAIEKQEAGVLLESKNKYLKGIYHSK